MPMTEKDAIEEYQRTGSKRQAAKNLGMSRSTLRRWVKKASVQIEGVTPNFTTVDTDTLISRLIETQERKDRAIALSRNQRVIINDNKPIVLAIFSDTHWGNSKCDYRALINDTKAVAGCPFAYALGSGDFSERWLGKLGYIAREQSITQDAENTLLKWWFDYLSDSWIAVCAGNHDNRSIIQAGIDYVRSCLGDSILLYDQDQVLFTLEHAGAEIRFKVRHRDKCKSDLNPYHGAFTDARTGDWPFDVYISGHDHRATLIGEFVQHSKLKLAVRLGTYKMDDRYAKAWGFPQSVGTGSAALVIDKGTVQGFRSIDAAITYCGMLRG
jgi:transposase-like protein